MLAWVLHRIVLPVCMACVSYFNWCLSYYNKTMFRFVSGGYDCRNNNPWTAANRAQEKYFFKHGNKMFVATTSEGVGRCPVHLELDSSKASRCVPDKDAGDEERSTI